MIFKRLKHAKFHNNFMINSKVLSRSALEVWISSESILAQKILMTSLRPFSLARFKPYSSLMVHRKIILKGSTQLKKSRKMTQHSFVSSSLDKISYVDQYADVRYLANSQNLGRAKFVRHWVCRNTISENRDVMIIVVTCLLIHTIGASEL